jgi:radical SAM protein with 4Fe4S-binding SPASM domain
MSTVVQEPDTSEASQPSKLERPKLHSVALELTATCNQKCTYCYNDWREDNGAEVETGDTEQMLARARKLLDSLDIDHFTLTGGEPFARADIWELFDLLRSYETRVQMISNGGLITERIASRLAEYDVMYVQVTLNGPTAELHEEHVGPGHFEPTLRGVRELQKHGVPVVGCVVVTRQNGPVLGEILELWHSLGVRQIALSRFSPAGYAVSHAARLLPTRASLIEAFEQAVPYARDKGMRISCTMPVPPCTMELADFAPLEFGFCPIGTSMQEVALGPDGKLRNCTLHSHAIGGVDDILDPGVDLAALMRSPDVTEYKRQLHEFCEGCVYADSCGGGCGAAAQFMLARDPQDRRFPDPFLWQHVDDDFEARLEREREAGVRRLEVIL